MKPLNNALTVTLMLLMAIAGSARAQQKLYTNDLNENYKAPAADRDYTKREVMIPSVWLPMSMASATDSRGGLSMRT